MSFGQVFGFKGNARTMVLLAVAAENHLDIELVETNPDDDLSSEYLAMQPLHLIPAFRAPDGWYLTEVMAIAIYFAKQNQNTQLLGRTDREYAEIIRWMSLVNSEIQPHLANWFKPLVHRRPYVKENVEKASIAVNRGIAIVEAHLASKNSTYFLGETVTLADLFAASSFSRGFQYVFDRDWQDAHPYVTKWFRNLVKQPIWHMVVPSPIFVEEAIKYIAKS